MRRGHGVIPRPIRTLTWATGINHKTLGNADSLVIATASGDGLFDRDLQFEVTRASFEGGVLPSRRELKTDAFRGS